MTTPQSIQRMNPGSKQHPGCLVLLIIALLISIAACGQPKDTVVTDSTPLLTIKHIDRVAKYLEDKMIAKDYNLIMAALNAVLQEAVTERKRKQKTN